MRYLQFHLIVKKLEIAFNNSITFVYFNFEYAISEYDIDLCFKDDQQLEIETVALYKSKFIHLTCAPFE